MTASPADLITLARAKQNLPSVTDTSQDTNLQTLITAASRQIARYCRREFVQTDFDELYNGAGDRRLMLRNYPLLSVSSVRYRPVTVLKVINNNASLNQQARVTVSATGLTVLRVASGVKTTDTSITFVGNVTLQAVANAVNALGNGWSAQVVADYANWPSADLYCPNGITSTRSDAPLPSAQGALTVWGQFAELKMHTYELAGYQLDQRRGWLLRAIPYTDPELLHPEDLIWPTGVNNFRVQYTAGYATVPEDVQEACAELVVLYFKYFDRSQTVTHIVTTGLTTDLGHTKVFGDPFPAAIKTLLAPYRRHRVANDQG